eukprot:331768-Hanusia_phi.AAC.4
MLSTSPVIVAFHRRSDRNFERFADPAHPRHPCRARGELTWRKRQGGRGALFQVAFAEASRLLVRGVGEVELALEPRREQIGGKPGELDPP